MDELSKAIKKTNNYASNYGQKLNSRQIFLRLISPKVYKFSQVKKYGSNELQNNEWKRKISLGQKLVEEHLSKMKGIKMIGVTGSVAAESARMEEDIDLLIVTSMNELWWWRLYLRLYIWWHRIPHRRFGKEEKRNEFCFNLWLDEDKLNIPKSKRHLKSANDLIMMRVIWEKDGVYQKFLKKNSWVKKYLATGYGERMKISRKIKTRNKILDFKKEKKKYLIKKAINRFLFWGQYFYMYLKGNKKIGPDDINKGQAFFHKNY